ncbi:hypothetical protein [Arthrobacter sp. STN4]|uniref:hypothetical protein n=1 Tax=Arthrobacter sp. STN4 TaxID=2923276 RepID=UPI00211AA4B7|nr:hypothetical protein [Arthrobacter sp. STN4]MCQ9162946.1 hypothetical protein [Arthrobacter sp. STN4]
MKTAHTPSVHLTDGNVDFVDDRLVEMNSSVLKVDVAHAEAARAALLSVGLRTKLINRHWPGSRTRQYELLWGNQTAEEEATDLAAARAALVRAGFELGI